MCIIISAVHFVNVLVATIYLLPLYSAVSSAATRLGKQSQTWLILKHETLRFAHYFDPNESYFLIRISAKFLNKYE